MQYHFLWQNPSPQNPNFREQLLFPLQIFELEESIFYPHNQDPPQRRARLQPPPYLIDLVSDANTFS